MCVNVFADETDEICSTNKTGDQERLLCTFTMEDKTCFVTITRTLNSATPPRLVIDSVKQNDISKTSYTCNSGITFSLNIPLNKGLNGFDQVSVSGSSSSGIYKITGLEAYSANSPKVKCAGPDYNIIVDEEDGWVCKIEIYADENNNVIMKYGDQEATNPTKKKNNSSYICSYAGDSETFTLSKDMKQGELTDTSKCPKINTSAKTEADNVGQDNQTPERDSENDNDADTNIPGYNHNVDDPKELGCESIFTGDLQQYLEKIFSIMKYLGIVLCIGLSIVDFVKAILDDDKNALNKITKRVLTRLLLVALLFFLPTIVNFIVTLIDENACTINF